jgi:anti-sigma factor RsiW
MKNVGVTDIERHERAIMNCKQCSELLLDYNRGELPADTRLTVAGHLSTCDLCAAEVARLQSLDALLDRTEQPSSGFRENFQARLAAEIAQTGRSLRHELPPRTGLFQTLWPARPFAAVCYSVALLACGLVSGQLLPPATLGITNNFVDQENSQRDIPQICSVPFPANNEVL